MLKLHKNSTLLISFVIVDVQYRFYLFKKNVEMKIIFNAVMAHGEIN